MRVRGPAGANESGSSTRCLSDGWLLVVVDVCWDMSWTWDVFSEKTGCFQTKPDELNVEMG